MLQLEACFAGSARKIESEDRTAEDVQEQHIWGFPIKCIHWKWKRKVPKTSLGAVNSAQLGIADIRPRATGQRCDSSCADSSRETEPRRAVSVISKDSEHNRCCNLLRAVGRWAGKTGSRVESDSSTLANKEQVGRERWCRILSCRVDNIPATSQDEEPGRGNRIIQPSSKARPNSGKHGRGQDETRSVSNRSYISQGGNHGRRAQRHAAKANRKTNNRPPTVIPLELRIPSIRKETKPLTFTKRPSDEIIKGRSGSARQ